MRDEEVGGKMECERGNGSVIIYLGDLTLFLHYKYLKLYFYVNLSISMLCDFICYHHKGKTVYSSSYLVDLYTLSYMTHGCLLNVIWEKALVGLKPRILNSRL